MEEFARFSRILFNTDSAIWSRISRVEINVLEWGDSDFNMFCPWVNKVAREYFSTCASLFYLKKWMSDNLVNQGLIMARSFCYHCYTETINANSFNITD